MASTLSLLLIADGTHQAGSNLQKNMNRLIGVALAKMIPILIITGISYISTSLNPDHHFDCWSTSRKVLQFFFVFFYVSLCCYVYYSSVLWGYVGCLVAGLGVYQL